MATEEEMRHMVHEMHLRIEAEKKKIVNDLHDSLNSDLLIARMHAMQILSHATKMDDTPVTAEIKESCNAIINLTSEVYRKFKDISLGLHPDVLDVLGLDDALEDMVANLHVLHPSCRFFYYGIADLPLMPSAYSHAIYRVVQEALSNIVKHANAKNVEVELTLVHESNCLEIGITDDGTGFDLSNAKEGIGLTGMRGRIDALNGKFTIDSQLGVGTKINILVHLENTPTK